MWLCRQLMLFLKDTFNLHIHGAIRPKKLIFLHLPFHLSDSPKSDQLLFILYDCSHVLYTNLKVFVWEYPKIVKSK